MPRAPTHTSEDGKAGFITNRACDLALKLYLIPSFRTYSQYRIEGRQACMEATTRLMEITDNFPLDWAATSLLFILLPGNLHAFV